MSIFDYYRANLKITVHDFEITGRTMIRIGIQKINESTAKRQLRESTTKSCFGMKRISKLWENVIANKTSRLLSAAGKPPNNR